METIIYQGQPIEAELVNYLSGNIPTSTVDMDGDEDLFRDEQGRYYLRRTLNWLDDDCQRRASGRTLIHRINVNAAILWATTRLNSETLHLRGDAANLLMENRGYVDSNPTHLSAKQLAMVCEPECFSALSLPVGDDQTVPVILHLPRKLHRLIAAMAEYDGREGVEAAILHSMEGEVKAWLHSPKENEVPQFLAQHLTEEAA